MTDHTQAPERMWIRTDPEHHARWGCWYVTEGPLAAPPRTEYTRTDTIPRWSTDMDAAPVGVDVLIWSKSSRCDVAARDEDGDWWVCGLGTGFRPTHWMPITPPEGE